MIVTRRREQRLYPRDGMHLRKITLWFFITGLLANWSHAEVRVSVQDTNGTAWIVYTCTAGERVRAFALDVSVDRGQIIGITGFFRGESKPGATGYGIFPASFRDHIVVGSGQSMDWSPSDYTPLANPADNPQGTLPGLNSSGVTLELGALWDPTADGSIPGTTGTLCALQLSEPANVSVSANVSRGGVVSAFPEVSIQTVFFSGPVGPSILSATVQNATMTVLFHGGELQTAPTVNGPWTDTGEVGGMHVESVANNRGQFFRVRGL